MKDRRQSRRWEGQIPVDLEDQSGLIFEAVGLNFSVGGMFLLFPDASLPVIGLNYGVKFSLPTLDTPIKNNIQVLWIDLIRPKLCGARFLQGLRAQETYTLLELIKLEEKSNS